MSDRMQKVAAEILEEKDFSKSGLRPRPHAGERFSGMIETAQRLVG